MTTTAKEEKKSVAWVHGLSVYFLRKGFLMRGNRANDYLFSFICVLRVNAADTKIKSRSNGIKLCVRTIENP